MLKSMMTYLMALAILSSSALPAVSLEQLSGFEGQWRSSDNAFAQPAVSQLTWRPALAGKFMRLDYSISAISNQTSREIFTAAAYYHQNPAGQL